MLNDWLGLVLVIILVMINAFFVAAEFSLVSVRKTRIAERVARGDTGANAIQKAIADPTRFIAATQLGVTLASLGLGWIGEPALSHLIEPWLAWLPGQIAGTAAHIAAAGIIAFVLITSLHVILGELMPKSMALQRPERAALLVARPILLVEQLFRPFIWILNSAGNFLLRALGFNRSSEKDHLHSVEELKMLVDASEEGGVLEKQESEMLHAVFDFGDLTAHQVMVPRTEMITLDVETPLEEVYDFAAQHHRTKYPVYENDLDHITGILHVKDLVPAMRLPPDRRPALRQLMREPLFVPATIGVNDLLARFRQRKQHIAILLDEYGGTAGLVALQDILEELIGEMSDGFGPDEPEIQKLPDGRLRLSGLMLLTDFNATFAVNLVDPNYETIAGYMMGQLDRIPKAGDEVEVPAGDHDLLRLRVDVMDGKRIAWITLTQIAR
ncbi:MAG TPA: hemolysin family protein [Anaerolineae bacterium]|nr:hemolysin family protein [Anaerolineae bacterium]